VPVSPFERGCLDLTAWYPSLSEIRSRERSILVRTKAVQIGLKAANRRREIRRLQAEIRLPPDVLHPTSSLA